PTGRRVRSCDVQAPAATPPNAAEHRREVDEPSRLRLVAPFAPYGMVDVLLAAFLAAAGRLEVPPRVGAKPHRAPCRRDRERGQPAPNGPVAHRLPRVVEILEAAAASAAGEPRLVAVDIAQRRVARDGAHDHGPGAVRPARVRG